MVEVGSGRIRLLIVPPPWRKSRDWVAAVFHLGVTPGVVAVWLPSAVVVIAAVTEIPRAAVWAKTTIRLIWIPLTAMVTGSWCLLPVVEVGRRVVTIGVIVVTAYCLLSGGRLLAWSIILPRPRRFSGQRSWVGGVRSGFDLMNGGGGGAVEHVIFTLLDRMVS